MTSPAQPPETPRGRAPDRHGPSLQAWLTSVLVLLALMVVGTGALGAALLSHTTTAGNRLVDGILPAQRDALRLETALLDQETGVRGYLLADEPALLEPYERGLTNETDAARRLATVLAGDEGDDGVREDLAAVQEAARTWREQFAAPALASVEKGTAPPSLQDGKDRFDEVRRRIAAQQARLDRIQADARTTFGEARSQRDHILLAIVVAFLLAGTALAVLLHVGVLRPLALVRTASQRVADGAFEEEIPLRGPSDLRALARAVEAMRHRTVAELKASRRNAERLDRTAAELDAQAVELRRSNAELEQFAYVASHDLQEPLRKVASFCQLLEKRYGDQLDERGAQYIGFAVDGAKRMQVLINDLLTFSRVGRVQDARETVAMDGPLDRALRNLAAAVEESGAEIIRPERLPDVVGDPTLLTMLWQNLVGNAVKFRSPDRAPRVEVALAEGRDAEPGFHTFTVTDNGIGVPAEFAEKVFVIFQRLHGRETYGGTGIGLSLCKKIVEHAGGRIRIDTDHREGTRIVFTLPVAAATTDTADTDTDTDTDTGAAETAESGAGAEPPAAVPTEGTLR
ncbi:MULTISPECIES: sensor histidine kinase [unclassified Streptomyces]|uniref:sensor histidine kinase n=1 Tax=unclassified Streptomyces TaxID=2593676 RepID=UPI000A78D80D|nr:MULTISPECIES: ATP-binding protein [unclassified Streptomyces]